MRSSRPNIIIVVHGKSEYILFREILKKRRMVNDVPIYMRSRGEETIAISHLHDLFTTGELSSDTKIIRLYGEQLDHGSKGPKRLENVRIFTVMDIDHDEKNRKRYKTGNVLNDLPISARVVPIYNEENLDEVMTALGYDVDINSKKSSYTDIARDIDPFDFLDRLKKAEEESFPSTNMAMLVSAILKRE